MYPKIGEEFELTLTPDQCDPLAMVKNFGCDPKGWKHTGNKVESRTIKCKLVRIGCCTNLDEVRKKLEKLGEIPNGLFLQSFKEKYPKPDGNGPVGITDSSWVSPHGNAFSPFVRTDGVTVFIWADAGFGGDGWRWLVLSK